MAVAGAEGIGLGIDDEDQRLAIQLQDLDAGNPDGVGEPARPISVLPLRTDSMTSSGVNAALTLSRTDGMRPGESGDHGRQRLDPG